MLASSHRFAHAIMALEAGLPSTPPVPARQEVRIFMEDVEKTLALLEQVLTGVRVAGKKFPNLREDHNRIIAAGDPENQRYALVNIEADRMTKSLNTLREEILEWAHMRRGAGAAESVAASTPVAKA
jgi:hypothetical protein